MEHAESKTEFVKSSMSNKPAGTRAPTGRSLRLTFAYDETGIRLAGSNRRSKPALRGDDLSREAPVNAVTIELRTKDGSALHRRALRDPIPQSVEVTGDAGKLQRIATPQPRGAFVVIVPDLDDATDIVIDAGAGVVLDQPGFAAPPVEGRRRRELARFAMPGRS